MLRFLANDVLGLIYLYAGPQAGAILMRTNQAAYTALQPYHPVVLGAASQTEVQGENMNHVYLRLDLPTQPADGDRLILRVEALCQSHDQGWATGEGSWTWAEISLEDGEGNEVANRLPFFTNARASNAWQKHHAVFDATHELVHIIHALRPRRIAIVLRSAYPGWRIYCQSASLRVWHVMNA
eukprot:TRINITY_DN8547_c0_g1_i1.p1 TRINITY_DN8547_c0_g1~~TRINITY_DN8547_c0_g1_i1.p1  ORF type:complete len:192 (+),score=12.01 TRINITY_DN8547_c0_g1_i1:28-576(+)